MGNPKLNNRALFSPIKAKLKALGAYGINVNSRKKAIPALGLRWL